MERITGPRNGYYIAAYAKPVGLGRYVGRAVICTERPRDFRGALGVRSVSSRGIYVGPEKALQAVEFQAKGVIDAMKPNWSPFTEPGTLDSQ